jgi:hypothetical protein
VPHAAIHLSPSCIPAEQPTSLLLLGERGHVTNVGEMVGDKEAAMVVDKSAGEREGATLGNVVGVEVGTCVAPSGKLVGYCVGKAVGCAVGTDEGEDVGRCVAPAGRSVGRSVGIWVGKADACCADGRLVGPCVAPSGK